MVYLRNIFGIISVPKVLMALVCTLFHEISRPSRQLHSSRSEPESICHLTVSVISMSIHVALYKVELSSAFPIT